MSRKSQFQVLIHCIVVFFVLFAFADSLHADPPPQQTLTVRSTTIRQPQHLRARRRRHRRVSRRRCRHPRVRRARRRCRRAPTPTSTPTPTVTPTASPTPTLTPTPTSTPTPDPSNCPASPSPTPTASATPDIDDKPVSGYSVSGPNYPEDEVLVNVAMVPEVVSQLYASSGAPPETDQFLSALQAVSMNSTVTLYLGFVMQPGFIVRNTDGMTLNSIYLSTRVCSTTCLPNQPDEIATFSLASWQNNDVTAQADISSTNGICGILAVTHGLVARTVVVPNWSGVTDGDKWVDGYVNLVWQQAGARSGANLTELKNSFRADWNSVWRNRCYATKIPREADSCEQGALSLKQWCEGLNRNVHTKNDACVFVLRGGGNDGQAGHATYTLGARWDSNNSKCIINTVDTGRGGSPIGTNVPRSPGAQTWEVSGTAGDQTITNTAGRSQSFWNELNFKSVESFCCDEERKKPGDPPERKGAVWFSHADTD